VGGELEGGGISVHILIMKLLLTMKNGVFWDVTRCGSCKNRRFGGT
jgi:hypothetical protein